MTTLESSKYLVAVTGEISRLGCFVKTTTPFASGDTVNLRITYNGKVFVVRGAVVSVLPTKGMGIAFGTIPANQQALLEEWLAQCPI